MDTERFFAGIKGKRIALCGIGRSHIPLAALFIKKGATVSMRDRRSREELGETVRTLETQGVQLVLGGNYLQELTEDIIFRTPGMKFSLPELTGARENGQVVTSELEVFFDLCPCKIYGVTGSDGKTTTTTVISEMLQAQGKTVHLGGNIGKPLLPEIEGISPGDAAVVELSSFQLISMRKSPDVAVITNLSPNHLDWHSDMDEYITAKKNLITHQNAFSRVVLNADNALTQALCRETRGDIWMFSRQGAVRRGCFCRDGIIYCGDSPILNTKDIRIPGTHNIENYMAAICAVYGDVSRESIVKTAKIFGGAEHRAEFVRCVDDVKYYNDSIASSPTRTISGTLSLYPEKIILIAGGYDKHIPYDALGPVICQKVKTLILMGDTAAQIEAATKNAACYEESCPEILHVENMEQAVAAARAGAVPGDIVSLSPASASFGLYKDFEERGRHFKQLINQLT